MGYVFAACANLGVGGSTESWKTVFWIAGEWIDSCPWNMGLTIFIAGISIGVGLIRILFPESKQFIEAKKAGKKNANAVEFWRETKVMLAKEWRICIYSIILMTWVSSLKHALHMQRPDLTHYLPVQLLLPHVPRFIHHLHAHSERARQCRCFQSINPYENRSLRRRHNHRLPVAIRGPSPSHHRLRADVRDPHPSLDSP